VSIVVTTIRGRVIRTIKGADFPAFTPSGDLLYELALRIMVAPASGGAARAITPASLQADSPAWLG
jgi:hypothetical protein